MKTTDAGLLLQDVGVREVLNSLADGAYITAADRTILSWNAAAERITGWTAREVVGRRCHDNILAHVDKDGHALCGEDYCPLHRAIVTGQPSQAATLIFARHRDGKRVPVEVSVAPLIDARGQVVGGVELFRDSTLLMDDLWRAKLIQQHALEGVLPVDARLEFQVRYVPEELVGGDFYHIEALDSDHYGLMVGDVMGHGVAAALYCMQLRSLWEDLRSELLSPSKFVHALNQRLQVLTRPEGYFATAVYLVLNARTGGIRYVRAGGPRPLIVHSDGSTQWLADRNPALGLLAGATYHESTTDLGAGDSLLVFTDGAVEVTDAEDRDLDEEGLRALALRSAWDGTRISVENLEQSLLEFCGRVRLPDDLTLLTVRRVGDPQPRKPSEPPPCA